MELNSFEHTGDLPVTANAATKQLKDKKLNNKTPLKFKTSVENKYAASAAEKKDANSWL